MAVEKKQKTKRPFLKWGLILLGVALLLGAIFIVGLFVFNSIVFIRNSIALFLLGGSGVGIGLGVVKGINRLVNGKNNEASQSEKLIRNKEKVITQEQEQKQEQELGDNEEENLMEIPVEARDEGGKKIEGTVLPNSSNSQTPKSR